MAGDGHPRSGSPDVRRPPAPGLRWTVLRWLPWGVLASTAAGTTLTVWLQLRADAGGLATLLTDGAIGLGFLGFSVVGAVLASRLPANPVGWLCLLLGLAAWSSGVAGELDSRVLPGSWPLEYVHREGWPLAAGLAGLTVLLFPTGRLPSPGWRWLLRGIVLACAITVTAGVFMPADRGDVPSSAPWATSGTVGEVVLGFHDGAMFVLAVAWFLATASVASRYLRAGAVERQQLRWLLSAVLLNLGQLVVIPLVPEVVGSVYQGVVVALVPAAIGIAVFRYRLYELDRLISRTVAYGLLTGALVVLYLVVVAVLRPLLEPLTGGSSLAVAGSTLVVAALSNPARRRLQAVVDRRFDRARYDAARAVDAFTARLRDQVDLDEVTAGLRDTVASTVAPTRVAVWLRAAPPGREA